jgi:transcriptional regulator with XRE-family HTH domain
MKKSSSRAFLPPAAESALMRLGERISAARRIRRLTQADLAAKAGVGLSTIAAIEAGSPTVQIGFYTSALFAVDALRGVDEIAVLSNDSLAVEQLGSRLLPQRVRR